MPFTSFMFSTIAPVALAASAFAAQATPGKWFDNYIFVIMENNDIANILKNPEYASWVSEGVEFLDYHGVVHPSQPNYWATISQSTHRDAHDWSGNLINSTNGDNNFNLTGAHIADSLEAAGLDWAIYSEDYPGNATNCYLLDWGKEDNVTDPSQPEYWENNKGLNNRLYKRKHNPFMSFDSIYNNASRCGAHIKSFNDWEDAVAADMFPAYSYIVPNQVDDIHDFPGDSNAAGDQAPGNKEGIQKSADWFAKLLSQIQASKYLNSRRTLVHLTFDEDDLAYALKDLKAQNCTDINLDCKGDFFDNQVYSVLLGSAVSCYTNSNISGHFDHNSIASTLVANWGLSPVTQNDSNPVWPLKTCPIGPSYAPSAIYSSSASKSVVGVVAIALIAALYSF